MQSRREILRQSLVLSSVASSRYKYSSTHGPERKIVSDASYLSAESSDGFQPLLAYTSKIIIVAGLQSMTPGLADELYQRVNRGSWVVWDHAPQVANAADLHALEETLNTLFKIKLGEARPVSSSELYVRYTWPVPHLVRTFLSCTPVFCLPSEAIASYGSVPVALQRRVGRGGIVFLGSMLGPQLKAGDREAHQLANQLLLTA